MVIYKSKNIEVRFSRGVCRIDYAGIKYNHKFDVNKLLLFLGVSPALTRLLRIDECTIAVDSKEENIVVFYRGQIVHYKLSKKVFRKIRVNFNGRVPLYSGACIVDDMLYFGEYFDNSSQSPVNIFKVDLNYYYVAKLELPREFRCRHIHGVFFDRYEKYFWICTGDSDAESKILRFKDFNADDIEMIQGGSQKYRATSMVFTKDDVYWGMDSPEEPAFLLRLDRASGKIELLSEFQAPIWFLREVGEDQIIVCTTVEPGHSVRTKEASIYVYCKKSGQINIYKSFKKDCYPFIFKFGVIFPIDGTQLKSVTDFKYNLQGLLTHDR